MKINLKNYVTDKTIIVDKPKTYPKFVFDTIKENETLIKSYYEEQKIIDIRNKKENYYPTINPNKYLHKLNNVCEDLAAELVYQEYSVIGFHCTRLVEEEMQDIKNNGFKLFDKEKHCQKLNILSKYGFTEEEINQLKKFSYVENGHRKNKIYVSFSTSTINFDYGLNNFLNVWGGEITFWNSDIPKEILEKLKKVGYLCLIITKIQLTQDLFYKLMSIVKSLIGHLYNKEKILETETYLTNADIPVLDLKTFDRENGDYLVYE